MKRHVALCVLSLAVLPAPTAAQTVNYDKFTPSVLPSTATQPVVLEVEMSGQPTRMTLDYQPQGVATVIDLRDDGTGGDRRAGDNTWSAQISVAPILAGRRADDVQRVFVGFLNVFSGTTNVLRGNMFISVHTPDLGTPGINRVSQFVQATSRVVNIHDAGYFVNRDVARVTREFYRWFDDDYDFLNLIYEPERFANRTHAQVKNEVEGVGLGIFNSSAAFGSAGRLQGISQFPIGTFFDGAETGHIHELGHQWVNFLTFQPLAPGIPHWPVSSMAGGVMGFSIGGQGGQGGSFRCDVRDESGVVILGPRPDAPAYNDFDLYLMGLLPASQVRTQIVFVDQAAAQGLQCNGQTFSGPVTRVTVDDIISRFGPRRPAAGSAPTQFRVATILVTRDDLATPEEMWLYSYFAARGELRERVPTHSGFLKELGQPFYLATGGRATLDMSIKLSGPDFSLVPTPSSRTVAAGSPATFSISAMPQGGSFDDTVRFTCGALPANASCSFSPTDVVPGTTGRDVVFTIATRSGTAEATGAVGGLAVSAGLVVAAAMTRPRGPRRRRAPAHWLEPFSLSCSEQSCGINPERSRSRAVSCYEEVRTALVVAALLLLPSCGKGGTGAPPPANPPPQTTPAGTYQITVTGTSGNLLRSTTVTLVVQ